MLLIGRKPKFVRVAGCGVLALVMAGGALDTPAHADCQPASVTDDANVVCSGTDTDGLNAGQGTQNVTITIEEGATVEADGMAILFGSDSTVVNNGTVTARDDYVMYGYADGHIVNNGSLILQSSYSSEFTADAVVRFLSGASIIENNGLLSASGTGIRTTLVGALLADDSQFLNTGDVIVDVSEGESGSGGYGAVVNRRSQIRNMGLIRVTATDVPASLTGMFSGGYSTLALVNDGDIEVILGGDQTFFGPIQTTGIEVGPQQQVLNNGSITVSSNAPGDRAYGIYGSPNVIRNSGSIIVEATGEGAVSYGIYQNGQTQIFNTGTIDADIAIYAKSPHQSVENTGTIRGDIALSGGDDFIDLGDGSVIDGDIDMGEGEDILVSLGVVSIAGKITGLNQFLVRGGELYVDLGTGSTIGIMNVAAGTVHLSGAFSGDLMIGIGARLDGAAQIGGDVQNAGDLLHDDIVGTLTIDGDYTQTATGQLSVDLGSSSADKLAVTGLATLDGTLSTALVGTDLDALEGKSYTVLTAGSISGALDAAGTVQQGFWTLNVQQSGTAVTVTVTDVDVTIGATAPVTGALASAIGAAAPGSESTGTSVSLDDQQASSLDYASLGDWESAAPTFVAGWSEMGARTPAGAMPKTGSAEFEGTTKGELTENGSPEAFVVEGNVLLTANFASGLVNADFTGMEKIDSKGVSSAWTDFRARMSIADGTSEFAGTAGSGDGVWNGRARGGFYGDEGGMPGHAAGMWSLSSSLGQAVGGFMAKRQ